MRETLSRAVLEHGSPLFQRRVNMSDPEDAELCLQYGNFMHAVPRPAAEAMFWTFFAMILFLLFASSWRFGRMMERIEGLKVGNPERQSRVYRCYWISISTGLLSLLIVILNCFVLLTLQFCDEEPLASLYWSVWTVLQVGGVVAIFGIALHTRHMIRGRRPPPWALALGTPVLVVAGLGHYFQGKIKTGTKKIAASRSRSRNPRGRRRFKEGSLSEIATSRGNSTDSGGRAMDRSEASDEDSRTVYGDASDKFNAKIIGYTKEGDVILRISPELTQELGRPRGSSSIKWDEPRPSPMAPPQISIETSAREANDGDAGTLRVESSRNRSNSNVTFKEADQNASSRPELPTLERSKTTDGGSSSRAQPRG